MNRTAPFLLILLIVAFGCRPTSDGGLNEDPFQSIGRGALLTTHFDSFEDFKKHVQVEYKKGRKPEVRLTHRSGEYEVTSVLKVGVSEEDIMQVRIGSFWDKLGLCFKSPYFVIHRQEVLKVYILGRRRHNLFGWKDVAFYDLAETMMDNIIDVGIVPQDSSDFSEKGYINTFNHINSQALMTTLFSEKLADFIADTHERSTLPELISGAFSKEQLTDIKNGAVDNYVDFVNNEWGQEIGKVLKSKYKINRQTHWTPELLADYLNDIQKYYSEALQIGFDPYSREDEVVVRFSEKLNLVLKNASKMKGV